MPTHTSIPGQFNRTTNRFFQLGWPSFWLLAGIIAGLLGLAALLLLLMTGRF